jgi:hypothetical protein
MKTNRPPTDAHHARASVSHGITGIGQRRFALGYLAKLLSLAAVVLAAGELSSLASDPVGIYAFVDKVVLEPNDTTPERIQVWGGFALAEGRGEMYTSAKRAYMYFKLTPNKETLCRNEWMDLKAVAGTGTIVAFGQRHSNNGTVRKLDAKTENPDVYPIGFGMQKVSMKDYKPLNELKALRSGKASEKNAN